MPASPRSSPAHGSTYSQTPFWRGRLAPVRTCLGCRNRSDRSDLLRVIARDGEVLPDPSAVLPGRGGWVHPTSECIEAAIKRKAFGRALRVTGVLDTARIQTLAGESSDSPRRTG